MITEKITIKILVDNEAPDHLQAEHGFSLWLNHGSHQVLFDTGQSGALGHNAQMLGVSLTDIDTLVLSHGHYDHTGGLPDLLHATHRLKVYCHAAAFLPRYAVEGGLAKPVKITAESMASINSLPDEQVSWVSRPVTVADGVRISGEIPRNTSFETSGGPFYFDQDGRRADPIKDDMAIWMETPEGLIICLGCCHAGIINTLNYLCELSGTRKIRAIIGGLHLMTADEARLNHTIEELKKFDIQEIIPCHCTGEAAHKLLEENFSGRCGHAGLELQFN